MSDEINYFKVKYAFMPAWTLQQAAHLLLGYDPDSPTYKIDENNRVSVLLSWLRTLSQSMQLFHTGTAGWKEVPKFNVEHLFECMRAAKREPDEEICAARQLIWGKKPESQIDGRINKIIYRYAAKLMWDKHPTLYIPQVAEHLVGLTDKLNTKYGTTFKHYQASEIAGFLKGDSPHNKGAPKKGASQNDDVDWHYIIENM